ncbi:MAG: bifunctional riboflavin kinase/FAD synthetase, partial [Gaiellaceae bacterium]
MTVARRPSELERKPRAVAVGTFDGVHRGHRQVLRAAVDARLTPTVVTFDPHPREVFGYQVELISSLERRLELLADAGIEDVLVVEFSEQTAQTEPEDFAGQVLAAIGAEVV